MEDIRHEIQLLWQEIHNLKDAGTIDHDTENAFRERLGIDDFIALDTSSKLASSETQSVNEAGSSSYSAAKPMDGFREYTAPGGTVFYIPYYT